MLALRRLFRTWFVFTLSTVCAAPAAPREVTGDAEAAGEGVPTILRITKATGQATVIFAYETAPLDLSAFRDNAIPIKNGSSSELDVLIGAKSDLKKPWAHGTTGRFLVRASEALDMTALLARKSLPGDHPHVKRLGRLFAYPWGHNYHWSAIDPASIQQVTVRIEWTKASAGQTIEIGQPRGSGDYSTESALLDSFALPMVDEFGQAAWFDWPGKIHREEELSEDGRKDTAWAASLTGAGEKRTRFGGLAGDRRLEATGFFRVEKIDGQWWFVDPEGGLFWSLGVNAVGNGDPTAVQGREHLFPESLRDRKTVDFYKENLQRKYGADDWSARHAHLTVARMLDWGINTVGAWSNRDVIGTRRVPYTLILHTAMSGFNAVRKIPDPFSDSFAASLERGLGSFAAEHADSTWLLGVFIDNELSWPGENLLVEEIMNSPRDTPARVAFVDFLRERYGDAAALSKAWGKEVADFDVVTPKSGPGDGQAYRKDLDDFLAVFADKYFGLCRAAMNRHLPNHLYLGARFHVRNPIVTRSASRYCDVLSVNVYQHGLDGFSLKTDRDRPWLISEFHFGMRDHGTLGSGLTWAADAGNQAEVVQAYLSDALGHPNFVGAHWFQWADQPVTGRPDGENFGVGLVTLVDRPVKTLNDALRKVSRELYDDRFRFSEGRISKETIPPGKR